MRPRDKHISNRELNALVPSSSAASEQLRGFSAEEVRDADLHLRSCEDCNRRVLRYRRLINLSSELDNFNGNSAGPNCPKGIDWHEVADGLLPVFEVKQLITHAAFCDHCGPLLRDAAAVGRELSCELEPLGEEKQSSFPVPGSRAQTLRAQSTSVFGFMRPSLFTPMKWMSSALALVLIVGAVLAIQWMPRRSLSGPKFAEFAVDIHKEHTQGDLALEVHSDSQQKVNEWFQTRLPFALNLPVSSAAPDKQRSFDLEGARLVQVAGKTVAYVAYRMPEGPASLMVAPDSIAVASGGAELDFKKVSFHYATVKGYKVVTWSQHGLTYALVSHEGNRVQRSCMVCHSAMRDRDLTHTPTPLLDATSVAQQFVQ